MKLAIIKKIDFTFSNLVHSALVSMSGTTDEMFVHIQLENSFIKKVFGVEHIRFVNNKGCITIASASHSFVMQVAEIVSRELNEELQKETADLRLV